MKSSTYTFKIVEFHYAIIMLTIQARHHNVHMFFYRFLLLCIHVHCLLWCKACEHMSVSLSWIHMMRLPFFWILITLFAMMMACDSTSSAAYSTLTDNWLNFFMLVKTQSTFPLVFGCTSLMIGMSTWIDTNWLWIKTCHYTSMTLVTPFALT